MTLARVVALARYPVKSLRGEQLDRLEFDDRGVTGDRWWAVRTAAGKFGSGKNTRRFTRLPHLLELSARLHGLAEPIVTLPDGAEHKAGDPALDAAVSTLVGEPVTLTPEADIPHLDASAVHLVTTASLRWLAARLDRPDLAWTRTRANIVLDTPGDGRPEDDWTGHRLRIGGTTLEVLGGAVRCVMVGQAQGDLPEIPRLLPALAGHDLTFGVYARVVEAGFAAEGDPVLAR
ncbi:MOSC domain-containing protein [Crossiella sp. CA198]|uniref:MOSC domain-containing protein n=1 Tax=Crossiella sp. CA198 TaxID=3455607 RepID=UPI003F8D323A